MIFFVAPRDQAFGMRDYLDAWGRNVRGLLSVVSYEEVPAWTHAPAGTYIFSALDQLTAAGLAFVRDLQGQIRKSPAGCQVVNDVDRVLLRLDLLRELHRLGLNRHRAIRATECLDGLRFPVFLHEEFRHTGSLSPLLHSRRALDTALGRAVFRGFDLGELLVVEFLDTADAEGYYRKYTAYRVGPTIIARTLGRGRSWMLKAEGVEFSKEMIEEERAYVFENPFEERILEIFTISGIEYGRIDFSLKDGVPETWEINTNPSVGPSPQKKLTPDEFGSARQPIRDHFSRRFREALRTLEHRGPRELIPLEFDSTARAGSEPIVLSGHDPGSLVRLARRLGPFKPMLKGLARILSPAVARAARRHGRREGT